MWKWKKEENEKDSRQVNYLWVLAGGYLMYLGGELIYGVIKGESTLGFLGILAAAVFFAVGGWVCLREWKAYRQEKQASEETPEEGPLTIEEMDETQEDLDEEEP